MKFISAAQYHYIEPSWDHKYHLNDLLGRNYCFIRAIEIPGLDSKTIGSYSSPLLDALIESTKSKNVSYTEYKDILTSVKKHSGLISGKTKKFLLRFPTRMSFFILLIWGELARA